jgi:hypothetical protein
MKFALAALIGLVAADKIPLHHSPVTKADILSQNAYYQNRANAI